jgi:hypothetical protein
MDKGRDPRNRWGKYEAHVSTGVVTKGALRHTWSKITPLKPKTAAPPPPPPPPPPSPPPPPVMTQNTPRIAIVMRGVHNSPRNNRHRGDVQWRASLQAQRRYLFKPLAEANATVDIFISTNNYSDPKEPASFDAFLDDFRSLASGSLEIAMPKDEHLQKWKPVAGLDAMIKKQQAAAAAAASSSSSSSSSSSAEKKQQLWDCVIFWRFDVQPLVPITQWRVVPDFAATVPFRESITRDPAASCSGISSCPSIAARYGEDKVGHRLSDVAFIVSGAHLEKARESIAESHHNSGALHYIFQEFRKARMLGYALDGFWQSSHQNPLFQICRGVRPCPLKEWEGKQHFDRYNHCCGESKQDAVGVDSKGRGISFYDAYLRRGGAPAAPDVSLCPPCIQKEKGVLANTNANMNMNAKPNSVVA